MPSIRAEARRFLTYGFGTVSGSLLNFLLIPLYLSEFSAAEFGIINIVLMFVTFSSLFVSAGMMSAMQKRYFAVPDGERPAVVGTVVLYYVIAVGALGIVMIPLAGALSELFFDTRAWRDTLITVPVLVLLTLLFDIPLNILRLTRRASAFLILSTTRLLLDAAGKFILIVGMSVGVIGYPLASIGALAVSGLVGFILISDSVRLAFDRSQFRSLIRLSSPFIVTGFAIWSLKSVDRVMLNFIVSEAATGVYSLGTRFGQIYNIIFYQPLSALLPAVLFPIINKASRERVHAIMIRLMNGLVWGGGIVAAGIAIVSVGLIELMSSVMDVDAAYLDARALVPLLVGTNFLYSLTIPAGYSALYIEKTRILAGASLVAAITNVVLNAILIPSHGALGAATATLIAYAVNVVAVYASLTRVIRIPYRLAGVVVQVTASAATIYLVFKLQIDRGFPFALIGAILAAGALGLLGLATGLVDRTVLAWLRRRGRSEGPISWDARTSADAQKYWARRDEESSDYLFEAINRIPHTSVLEFGSNCGNRLYRAARRNPGVQYAGIDMNAAAIAVGTEGFAAERVGNVVLTVGDHRSLDDIPDGAYDVVSSWATLIYIPGHEIESVMKNLHRIARRGLVLIEMHDESLDSAELARGHVTGRGNWIRNYRYLLTQIDPAIAVECDAVPGELWAPGGGHGTLITAWKETP